MATQNNGKIVLTDRAKMITCAKCGKVFQSREGEEQYALDGKLPVYCDECQEAMLKTLIGGPLDGRKTYS